MGRVISFEGQAIARLRASETARDDLLAFARGHSEAVASIHRAVIAAVEAPDIEGLFAVVIDQWPAILGVDIAILALAIGGQGFRIDSSGTGWIDAAILARARNEVPNSLMRSVSRGHALFGPNCGTIRTEAIIPVENDPAFPSGLLLLGHGAAADANNEHGSELLEFLGRFLAAMMRRWIETPTPTPIQPAL